MKKLLLLFIILFSVAACKKSSTENSENLQADSINFTVDNKTICNENVNLYDANGLKTGLWIEDNGLKEIYYKKGKRNGIFRSYSKKSGKLDCLGECLDNQRIGTWYYFHENGHLILIEKDICINHETTTTDFGSEITPKFRSYVVLYYPNGEKKEEGIALYDEDIEIDYFKSNNWKYYDEFGNLIKK